MPDTPRSLRIGTPVVTRPGIGQGSARTFEQRLTDFGMNLRTFLARVWRERATINVTDIERGVDQIYGFYSGPDISRPFNGPEMRTFVRDIKAVAKGYILEPQSFDPESLDDVPLRVYAQDLWTDFFHVLSTEQPAYAIRSRVYVHATNTDASIEIMKVIVGQFGKNAGLWEVKTAGPGCVRLDTIVAYLRNGTAADNLVNVLKQTALTHPRWFTDELPPLVQRAGTGIGVADEPPAIEIFRRGGTRHSFGSFFSTLCWVALKGVPNLRSHDADGRHFLDNMLYNLRLLRVDPMNPVRFPDVRTLEAWYNAST